MRFEETNYMGVGEISYELCEPFASNVNDSKSILGRFDLFLV